MVVVPKQGMSKISAPIFFSVRCLHICTKEGRLVQISLPKIPYFKFSRANPPQLVYVFLKTLLTGKN